MEIAIHEKKTKNKKKNNPLKAAVAMFCADGSLIIQKSSIQGSKTMMMLQERKKINKERKKRGEG